MQRTTLRRSTQPGTVPNLLPGELGVNMANLADLKLYLGVSSGPPIDLLKQAPASNTTIFIPNQIIVTRDPATGWITLAVSGAVAADPNRTLCVLRDNSGSPTISPAAMPATLGEVDLGNTFIHAVNSIKPALIVTGTNPYVGASIRMQGPSATKPSKTLRVLNDSFEILADNGGVAIRVEDGGVIVANGLLLDNNTLKNAANDAAAATAGVRINQVYRNGNVLMWRAA